MYKFSVAIPTYNSSEYLKECIEGFKNSKFIDEIIVCDDGSEIQDKNNIKKIISDANQSFNFEIKFYENKDNKGAFKNKYELIELSKNDWVYQIDSDNVPFKDIDSVIVDVYNNHNSQLNIYYPAKLIQFRKYKKLAKFLSFFQKKYKINFTNERSSFDLEKVKEALLELLNYNTLNDKTEGSPELNSNFVIDKHIFWVLNCGNFLVNRDQFLKTMKPGLSLSREILSMDAVAFSYLWLKNAGTIVLLPNLGHYHRKRLNSVSFVEKESSKISRDYFTKKILATNNSNKELS